MESQKKHKIDLQVLRDFVARLTREVDLGQI